MTHYQRIILIRKDTLGGKALLSLSLISIQFPNIFANSKSISLAHSALITCQAVFRFFTFCCIPRVRYGCSCC